MTTAELAHEMASQIQQSITLKEIREAAVAKGYTPEQIDIAIEEAHTLVQQRAEQDPTIRMFLGPGLLIVAFVAFYTEWAGRSIGPGTFIGLIALWIGGRLVWSLVKQRLRAKPHK